MRLAFSWWCDADPVRAAEMALALTDFWLTRALTEEGASWLAAAVDGMPDDHPRRPDAEGWLSAYRWAHGDIEGSRTAAVERVMNSAFPRP